MQKKFLNWLLCGYFFSLLNFAHSVTISRQDLYKGRFAAGHPLPKVLAFHEIAVEPGNRYAFSLKQFKLFLDWLEDMHIEVITVDEFWDLYKKVTRRRIESTGKQIRKRIKMQANHHKVLLTFDDGYIGIFKNAVPELISRNLPATFFVHPKYMADTLHFSWDHISFLQNHRLFEVGSHTYSHKVLTRVQNEELRKELVLSKKILIEKSGSCRFIAYPNGAYNANVLREVKDVPYLLGFGYYSSIDALLNNYRNYGYSEGLSIPRLGIERDTNMEIIKSFIID